jgi:hypothetical protein
MKRALESTLKTLVLLSFTAVAVAQGGAVQAHQKIVDLLKAGEVSKIVIIHVPGDLETRIDIDQQALRRLTRIEFSFTKPGEERIIEPLQTALEELTYSSTSANPFPDSSKPKKNNPESHQTQNDYKPDELKKGPRGSQIHPVQFTALGNGNIRVTPIDGSCMPAAAGL